jgi:ABC-2 type transport system permease protein
MSKNPESFFGRIIEGLNDACYIWRKEMKQNVMDEGMLIFFVVVPLLYPLLYSWIYTNEVVRDTPVVVVDRSGSFLSRDFTRKLDASPGVKVVGNLPDVPSAKEAMRKQNCRGIIVIPEDFDKKINRLEQSTVTAFCDMSGILYYSNIRGAVTDVSLEMGKELQKERLGAYTDRDEEVSTEPILQERVNLFNPASGYGSFVLPAVLMLIAQQTILLGVGIAAGTSRETNRYHQLVPISRHYNGIFRIVIGKSMGVMMVYIFMLAYLTMVVPKFFHFIQLASFANIVALGLPYLLACTFFAFTLSCFVRYRENVILLVVFTSLPLFFISGVSWPGCAIPWYWKLVGTIFPSTYGINAFVRLNSMGAHLSDVLPELRALWIQVVVYFITACTVYRLQIIISRRSGLERLGFMKKREHAVLFFPKDNDEHINEIYDSESDEGEDEIGYRKMAHSADDAIRREEETGVYKDENDKK